MVNEMKIKIVPLKLEGKGNCGYVCVGVDFNSLNKRYQVLMSISLDCIQLKKKNPLKLIYYQYNVLTMKTSVE